MAGYTRQSVADIIANAIIKATPVNNEFNTIRDAFAQTTGHTHDGTASEGAYVPLISDTDAYNKVVVDAVNNRISFYNEISSVAVEQVRIEDGVFAPVTTNDVDLGATGAEFKDLYIDGIGYIDTLAVHENATIVGTLGVTALTTLASVDINGGNIDATIIGAASASSGGFTTVSTTGQATLNSVSVGGGTIDGTAIGATTASTGAFTTISASTSITGDLTGNVTGNLTGNSAGIHTGAVTGALTGNVTAATGTSSFLNVTINGSLDMSATSAATVTGLSTPVLDSDAATKNYVDSEVSALVDSAPGTLDTLNELAAALGDDANYATTTATSIATKLPLAGGTMTGAIAMSTNKVTGLGDPTADQDAATKTYTDTKDGLKVTKAGDAMTGDLAMGSNKVTGLAAPTAGGDASNKTYVDNLLGSGVSAATSAAAALVSETNAATSATNAGTSATNANTSALAAAASYDSFDDRYLGPKTTAPTVDNDGDALITGTLYFNSVLNIMYVYSGAGWQAAGSSVNGTSSRNVYVATGGQTVFTTSYDVGFVDVYLNGIKLQNSVDFTATSGTSITLTVAASVNDVLNTVAYGTFVLANHYSSAASDARYVQIAGDTMTGALNLNSNVTLDTNTGATSATAQTPVATFAHASFNSAKLLVTANNGTDTYISELLVVHNGTTASATEYGQVSTATFTVAYDVDINGTDVRLLATAPASTATTYKVLKTLL